MTQYWIPKENEWDEADADGRRIYLGDPEPRVPMMGRDNKLLARVPESMIKRCITEGACLLANGDLVHLHKDHVFEIIGHKDRRQNLFGYGAGVQNLVPFVSVASNNLPQGTTLYIPELNGLTLPMGAKHNGCVRVDDTGPGLEGKHLYCQLDLFVVSYTDYLSIRMPDRVTPQLRSCSVRNYVTKEYLSFVEASTDSAVLANAINDKAAPLQ
ncbi:hypothetical protein BX666DRAFT_2159707 [Dichotomocladium elegans]|nr:hypothetical protein BX666DRAFT_2159707 [Dichotomocladium elegans]